MFFDYQMRSEMRAGRILVLTTTIVAVAVTLLLARFSYNSVKISNCISTIQFVKDDSCLSELSDGHWELVTTGCVGMGGSPPYTSGCLPLDTGHLIWHRAVPCGLSP